MRTFLEQRDLRFNKMLNLGKVKSGGLAETELPDQVKSERRRKGWIPEKVSGEKWQEPVKAELARLWRL